MTHLFFLSLLTHTLLTQILLFLVAIKTDVFVLRETFFALHARVQNDEITRVACSLFSFAKVLKSYEVLYLTFRFKFCKWRGTVHVDSKETEVRFFWLARGARTLQRCTCKNRQGCHKNKFAYSGVADTNEM